MTSVNGNEAGLVGGETWSKGSQSNKGARRGSGSGTGGSGLNIAALREELDTIKRDPNPINRFASLTNLLSNLSEESLPEVLKAFEEIPMRYDHREEYQMLLYAWAAFDPEGALKFVQENANSRSIRKNDLMNPVVASWATVDPESTLQWYKDLPEEDQDSGLLKGLVKGLAVSDPYGAAEFLVESVEPGKNRENLAGEIASHLFKQDPNEAAKWATAQEDLKFKEEAFEELAEDWGSVDPKGLASWLGDHVSEEYSVEAFEDLARAWVSQNPDEATDYFEGLPDGKAKESAIYEMAKTWGSDDLSALGEWLNSMPDSQATDMGVKAYSQRLAGESPEAAIQSAMSINNDAIRDETVQQLGQQWFRKDPEGATAWANANGIPLETLQQPQRVVTTRDGVTFFHGDGANIKVEGLDVSPEEVSRMIEVSPEMLEQWQAQGAAVSGGLGGAVIGGVVGEEAAPQGN